MRPGYRLKEKRYLVELEYRPERSAHVVELNRKKALPGRT